jgi:hypothetical protein
VSLLRYEGSKAANDATLSYLDVCPIMIHPRLRGKFFDPGQGLGNVMGYPGIFQSNLCPYPSKPIPASMGAGF